MSTQKFLSTVLTLAIFAISFGSAAAGPSEQSCSDYQGCKGCLGNSNDNNDCAWLVGPENTSGCVDVDMCDEQDGECFYGVKGTDNSHVCGNTCSARAIGSEKPSYTGSCETCLEYNVFGGKGGKYRTDCAWLVRPGQPPMCIYRERCKEKQFEGGACLSGKKDGSNHGKKCAYDKVRDGCKRNRQCDDCLNSKKGTNCAWFVSDDEEENRVKHGGRCIGQGLCSDPDNQGTCYKGTQIFKPKQTCKRIKKAHGKKKGDDNDNSDSSPPSYDTVRCSKLSGLCKQCLVKTGCQWNNDKEICIDACDDDNCEGQTERQRHLVSFDEPQASEMCTNHLLEKKNAKLCKDFSGRDTCSECVVTQLYVPPGAYYVIPPLCRYVPDTGDCIPTSDHSDSNNDEDDGSVSTCNREQSNSDDDNLQEATPPPTFKRLPRGGESWPELFNSNVNVAINNLEATYGPTTLEIKVINPTNALSLTRDVRPNRVRVFVDGETASIIIKIPETG